MNVGIWVALASMSAGWFCFFLGRKSDTDVKVQYDVAALCWFVAGNLILWGTS